MTPDEMMNAYRAVIRTRANQQTVRHVNAVGRASWSQMVDIQIAQEIEFVKRLAQEEDATPQVVALLESFVDWLPDYGRELKLMRH